MSRISSFFWDGSQQVEGVRDSGESCPGDTRTVVSGVGDARGLAVWKMMGGGGMPAGLILGADVVGAIYKGL
jgi:hypothetical protein